MPERRTGFRLTTVAWVLFAAGLGWVGAHYFPVQRLFHRQPEILNLFTVRHIPAPQALTPFGHPYYPYSVILGGAHSRGELEKALAGDNVAAKHYSDFMVKNARIITLDKDHQYYVSYRVGDTIYWTRRVLTLYKGEQLLFDGVHYARARCGNRLSEVPAMPRIQLAQSEPSPKKFEAPVTIQMSLSMQVPHLDPAPDVPFEMASTRIEGLPQPLSNLAAPYAPEEPETVDYVSTRHDRATLFATDVPGSPTMLPTYYPAGTPSSAAVPEPGTLALGGLAILGIAAALYRGRQQSRDEFDPVRKDKICLLSFL
jgi:PEP-CTERM motif